MKKLTFGPLSIEFGSIDEQYQLSEAFDSQARELEEASKPDYKPARLDAQNTLTAVDAQEALLELETENLMIEDPVEYENQQIDFVRNSFDRGIDGSRSGGPG